MTHPDKRPFAERRLSPSRDIRWVVAMVLAIVIPAAITLDRVRGRPDPAFPGKEDSPLGYTISLLLFLFPVLVLASWRWQNRADTRHVRALLWSSGAIACIGFALDLFFGYSFFVFPNSAATLGIRLPAWSFETMSWVPSYLPIEEFGFYILGSLFVIVVYMWADADWLCDYSTEDFADLASTRGPLVRIHWPSLALWIVGMALGFWYKRTGPVPQGLPGYFIFIMVLGFLPTVLFLHTIEAFVNWRAFSFAYVNLTLVSLLWEATLGVPYNWWNYHHTHMLGLRITAWSSLPLEAVLLWLVVAWDCIIAYELFRVYFHMDRSVKEALVGVKGSRPLHTRDSR